MEDIQSDLDRLEDGLRLLFQYLKRPSSWQHITAQAGVDIDRPGAAIVHTLVSCGKSPCKLNDLADMLGVEAPSVTRKTQELERLGLIRRYRSLTDRRSVYLEVTEAGNEIEKHIRAARRTMNEQVLKGWSKTERQQFASLFERYAADLSKFSNDRDDKIKVV